MRTYTGALIAEGFKVARSSSVASLTTAFVVFLMTVTVFLSVGRSAAAEEAVVGSLDQAGSRVITVTATAEEFGLDRAALERIGRLSGIERAVALGSVVDTQNAWLPGGNRVPARAYFGELAPEITITNGRLPHPGEVIIGHDAQFTAGMQLPVGALSADQQTAPVVAGFTASGLLADLNRYAIRMADDGDDAATLVYVVAENVTDIPALTSAIGSLTGVRDAANLTVSAPVVLAELQQIVSGQVGQLSRQIALATLTGGLLFVAAILYATTANRRRDFGRRRALGASRSALVLIVLASTALPAGVGALFGSVVGVGVVKMLADDYPPTSLTLAIAVVAVLVGLIAAVPSAIASALRDPVRILRVA